MIIKNRSGPFKSKLFHRWEKMEESIRKITKVPLSTERGLPFLNFPHKVSNKYCSPLRCSGLDINYNSFYIQSSSGPRTGLSPVIFAACIRRIVIPVPAILVFFLSPFLRDSFVSSLFPAVPLYSRSRQSDRRHPGRDLGSIARIKQVIPAPVPAHREGKPDLSLLRSTIERQWRNSWSAHSLTSSSYADNLDPQYATSLRERAAYNLHAA